MPETPESRAHIVRLTGEVMALRAIVRRLAAHIAILDGGDVGFLRDELFVVLEELDQFAHDRMGKRDREAMRRRAQEIVNEAFTTIDIAGESVSTDD